LGGVTANETKAAADTVSVLEAITEPEAAVTAVAPTALLVAIPEALTVATPGCALLQTTFAVISTLLLSL
jgi:hypothetical protein